MKKRVELSTYCRIVSALTIALLCGIFLYAAKEAERWVLILLGIVITVLFLSTLFYMPLSISVDNRNLNINRFLRVKRIPLADIADVILCQQLWGQ